MASDPPRISTRQVKVPEPLYLAVEQRAHAEDADVVELIVGYITDYATDDKLPTPRLIVSFPGLGTAAVPESEAVHYDQQRKIATKLISFRIRDDYWRAAMDRANADGSALSPIITRFLRGYADHIIN